LITNLFLFQYHTVHDFILWGLFWLWFFFFFLGNPAIGILKHKERCYVFSSREAAYIFAQDPEKFIQLNVEKAKEHAELIQLLELRHQFEYLDSCAQVHIAHVSCTNSCWVTGRSALSRT